MFTLIKQKYPQFVFQLHAECFIFLTIWQLEYRNNGNRCMTFRSCLHANVHFLLVYTPALLSISDISVLILLRNSRASQCSMVISGRRYDAVTQLLDTQYILYIQCLLNAIHSFYTQKGRFLSFININFSNKS